MGTVDGEIVLIDANSLQRVNIKTIHGLPVTCLTLTTSPAKKHEVSFVSGSLDGYCILTPLEVHHPLLQKFYYEVTRLQIFFLMSFFKTKQE